MPLEAPFICKKDVRALDLINTSHPPDAALYALCILEPSHPFPYLNDRVSTLQQRDG